MCAPEKKRFCFVFFMNCWISLDLSQRNLEKKKKKISSLRILMKFLYVFAPLTLKYSLLPLLSSKSSVSEEWTPLFSLKLHILPYQLVCFVCGVLMCSDVMNNQSDNPIRFSKCERQKSCEMRSLQIRLKLRSYVVWNPI